MRHNLPMMTKTNNAAAARYHARADAAEQEAANAARRSGRSRQWREVAVAWAERANKWRARATAAEHRHVR